jgi:DNA-binding transcriptional regulator YiaG
VGKVVPVDWPKVIADIAATGVTPWDLSVALGVHYNTVQAWQEGRSEPRYSVGATLLALRDTSQNEVKVQQE